MERPGGVENTTHDNTAHDNTAHDNAMHDGAAFSNEDAARCASAMTRAHPWLEFRAATTPGELTISELFAHSAVTSAWSGNVHRLFRRQGADPPPYVAGVFVLQYAVGALAAASATAALAGPWRVEVIGLGLAPGQFPAVIHLADIGPLRDEAAPLEVARAAYESMAGPLAAGLEVGGHLGRHQRSAMVRDAWRMAVRDLTAPGRVVEREACCFIYLLPGCAECGGCPRLSRGRGEAQ